MAWARGPVNVEDVAAVDMFHNESEQFGNGKAVR